MVPSIEQPGVVGGMADGVAVRAVGWHDTASAVVGVPATTPRFAYVSSGTWSCVGLELAHPVLTTEARSANFTNEGGVDGRICFLRNVGGLWLLQESLRQWGIDDAGELMAEAAALPAGGPIIDVDDPLFLPPGRMPDRIAAAARSVGHRVPATRAATARCIIESLATAYARTVRQATKLAAATVD